MSENTGTGQEAMQEIREKFCAHDWAITKCFLCDKQINNTSQFEVKKFDPNSNFFRLRDGKKKQ